jgi:cupin superfamily acireductone dioxygenase involved in methionine salvage
MAYRDVKVEAGASSEKILKAYAPQIEQLKGRGGYVTADVIDVNPNTLGLETMLAKFKIEHTHDEDEVRFIVAVMDCSTSILPASLWLALRLSPAT